MQDVPAAPERDGCIAGKASAAHETERKTRVSSLLVVDERGSVTARIISLFQGNLFYDGRSSLSLKNCNVAEARALKCF